jgi:hypothetical protein
MAIAKTPKTALVKPAAAPKVAAKVVAPKPAAKPAAKAASAAKTPEDAVIHSTEVAAQAVEAAAKAVETVVAETVEAVKPAKAVAAPKAVKETEEKILVGVETFLEFGRDNAILLVSAGNDLALGLHKLSQSLLDWSAESCDKSVAGASALLSAKTVEEVIDLSQEMAKDGLQQLLKESSELGSLSSKLFENTFAALPGRMVAVVEKLASHAH